MRNCTHYDSSSSAEREKLQLLRPLQYCRKREMQLLRLFCTTTTDPYAIINPPTRAVKSIEGGRGVYYYEVNIAPNSRILTNKVPPSFRKPPYYFALRADWRPLYNKGGLWSPSGQLSKILCPLVQFYKGATLPHGNKKKQLYTGA